jgi:hypothetical protein
MGDKPARFRISRDVANSVGSIQIWPQNSCKKSLRYSEILITSPVNLRVFFPTRSYWKLVVNDITILALALARSFMTENSFELFEALFILGSVTIDYLCSIIFMLLFPFRFIFL